MEELNQEYQVLRIMWPTRVKDEAELEQARKDFKACRDKIGPSCRRSIPCTAGSGSSRRSLRRSPIRTTVHNRLRNVTTIELPIASDP